MIHHNDASGRGFGQEILLNPDIKNPCINVAFKKTDRQ